MVYTLAMRYILSVVLFLFASPALADMDAALEAYNEGHWRQASALAEEEGDAEALAFASRALLAQLMVEPNYPDRRRLMRDALRLAEDAYDLDEESYLARRQLAAAIGFKGRFMGGWRAYVQRIPQRGHNMLEILITENPNDAWTVGLMGAWHLEVIRRGGASGESMLNASIEAGIGFYSNAIALDPENLTPRYYLALGLIALDDPGHRTMALEQLQMVLEMQPRDAFEIGILAEARLLAGLQDDHREAAEWANERMEG